MINKTNRHAELDSASHTKRWRVKPAMTLHWFIEISLIRKYKQIKKTLLTFYSSLFTLFMLSTFALLSINSIEASAQVSPLNLPVYNYQNDSIFTQIGTYFNYYLGSNSINNKFALAIMNSKYLDDDLKNSNKLKRNNITGYDIHTGVYVAVMPDSMWGLSNFGYRIGLSHRQFRSANFSGDLYKLIFFGNEQFAGESVNFDNTRFRSIDYQKLELGIFKNYNDNNTKVNIFFGFNLLKGQQLQSLNINKGSFYTSIDGDYLDLDTKFSYFTSDQSHKQLSDFNGIGISCDAFFVVENTKSKLTFTFASEDLGYISWTKKSYIAGVDTTIHFDGVEITNIMNVAQESLHGLSKDSLMNIIYSKNDTVPFQLSIPEKLSFEVKKEWTGFINSATIGLNYIFDVGMPIPQFYAMQTAQIKKWLNIGLIENYGGFSGFNAGLYFQINTNKNFTATISSGNLTGFILPKDAYARSIFISLAYKIK